MTDTFLRRAARRILQDVAPGEMHQALVILPTKRACTFFERALVQETGGKATLAPGILTIDRWISSLGGTPIGERTTLLCLLYQVYEQFMAEQEHRPAEETRNPLLSFDRAGRMLSDFEEIDLAMADVQMIFRNLQGIEDLDREGLSFLTPEQKEAIKKFWGSLPAHLEGGQANEADEAADESPSLGDNFLHLAHILREVYARYQALLAQKNIAYRGSVYKQVALAAKENPSQLLTQTRKLYGGQINHIFAVGLYNFSEAEKTILLHLKEFQSGLLTFLWEPVEVPFRPGFSFEPDLLPKNRETFGGEVLGKLPSTPPPAESLARAESPSEPTDAAAPRGNAPITPQVSLLRAPSLVIQPMMIGQLLGEILAQDPSAVEELRVAVILNDERTLIPLLSSLKTPLQKDNTPLPANITMGFPLSATPPAIWLNRFIELFIRLAAQPKQEPWRFPVDELLSWLNTPNCKRLWGQDERYESLIQTLSKRYLFVSMEDLIPEHPEQREIMEELFPRERTGSALVEFLQGLVERLLDLDRRILQEQEEGAQARSAAPQGRSPESAPSSAQRAELYGIDPIEMETEYLEGYRRVLLTLRNTVLEMAPLFAQEPLPLTILLQSLVQSHKLSLEGDPLVGLQVMGFLETRTLDFDYLIMADVREGFLPANARTASFIPYDLRRGYGIPTYQEKDNVNTYHFFRLISSARHVYLTEDTRTASLEKNMPSRFIEQIRYLTALPLKTQNIALPDPSGGSVKIEVRGTQPDVTEWRRSLLGEGSPHEEGNEAQTESDAAQSPNSRQKSSNSRRNRERPYLSPTDLGTYNRCPLRFYFHKIRKISDPEPKQDFLEEPLLGTIIHRSLELLYEQMGGEFNPNVLSPEVIKEAIRRAYAEGRYGIPAERKKSAEKHTQVVRLLEMDRMNLQNIERYVQRALEIDRLYSRRYRIGSFLFEQKLRGACILSNGTCVPLGGYADRIDYLTPLTAPNQGQYGVAQTGFYRVLDYKSGRAEALKLPNPDQEPREEKSRKSHVDTEAKLLQLYLYTCLYPQADEPVAPLIYALSPAVAPGESALTWDGLPPGVHPTPGALFRSGGGVVTETFDPRNLILPGQGREGADGEDFAGQVEYVHNLLVRIVKEICNPETVFRQTTDHTLCNGCPYLDICGIEPQKF